MVIPPCPHNSLSTIVRFCEMVEPRIKPAEGHTKKAWLLHLLLPIDRLGCKSYATRTTSISNIDLIPRYTVVTKSDAGSRYIKINILIPTTGSSFVAVTVMAVSPLSEPEVWLMERFTEGLTTGVMVGLLAPIVSGSSP